MNRQRHQDNRLQHAQARLPPLRHSSSSRPDTLAQEALHPIGRRPSVSFTSHPIQNSTIGDRIQIEQLHTMSQLTANSYGSGDISYSGPPAHQNSSQSQSTFSVSSRAPRTGNMLSRLNPAPSVTEPLNPARALLHMGKIRRVKPTFPGSNSVTSIVSNDSRRSGQLLQFQRDARSTWGTQGSIQSINGTPVVDHDIVMRQALREELMTLFQRKQDELNEKFQTKQDELSSIVNAKLRESERAKAEEIKTLRLTIDNVSEEVKFQVDGLEQKLGKLSENLNTQMKDLHVHSTREVEEKSQELAIEFQTMVVAARMELKEQLSEAKQELTSEGRESLQVEAQRQIDAIKTYAKSWICDLKNLVELASSTVVQKCQGPISMVGALLQGSQNGKLVESDIAEEDDCGQKTRTISPLPLRTLRNKRTSPSSESQRHKRQKKNQLSHSSTVESAITVDTKSSIVPRRPRRTLAEIAPLKLRLSPRSNLSPAFQRKTRSSTNPLKNGACPRQSLSPVSLNNGETCKTQPKKSRQQGHVSKEIKSPASLKIPSYSLVTPLREIDKVTGKSDFLVGFRLSKPLSCDGCHVQHSYENPNEDVEKGASINKIAFPVTKRSTAELAAASPYFEPSQETVSSTFPVHEIVTEHIGECPSPLSLTSTLRPKHARAKVPPPKKVMAVKNRSTKRVDNGAVRIRRRTKKTYSKRPQSSNTVDDHLTFSFHSDQ